jgi:hypothetical protein
MFLRLRRIQTWMAGTTRGRMYPGSLDVGGRDISSTWRSGFRGELILCEFGYPGAARCASVSYSDRICRGLLMLIYAQADARPEPTPTSRNLWHAVAIVGTSAACSAALACKESRYLSNCAPRLPIAGCDATRCDCRYRHFIDRRRPPRRASEKGAAPKKRVSVDRREHAGRRTSD